MRRHWFLTMILAAACVMAAHPAPAQENPLVTLRNLGLPEDLILDVKELVDDRTPPMVEDVVVEPQAPAAGEPVRVSARIFAKGRSRNAPVFDAAVLYSTDGGATWQRALMENRSRDDRIWSGEIPGMAAGTEVLYGIQAFSVNDEMYVEVVCDPQEDARPAPDPDTAACAGADNPELCALTMPSGCMFPVSFEEDDLVRYEDERVEITPSLDFRNGYAGHRDARVFMHMRFKDHVTHGSLSPPNLQFYVLGWLNPDLATAEQGIDAILKQGGVVELVVITISQAGPNMLDLKLRDASLFTRLKYVKRSYVVEE